jgi:uncharacterized protein
MRTIFKKNPILTFLFITFSLSSIFYFLIIQTGKLESGFSLYVTALMWCPAISAFITSKLLERKISALGWNWGKTKYQLWSYLIPIIYISIGYLIIWIFGFGGFYNQEFVKQIVTSFGFESVPNSIVILFFVILNGIFGMAGSASNAIGEEIGWRGFLVPELYNRFSYTKTSLITGLIWAVWHFPMLLFADYNSGTPAWFGLSCFTILVVCISFIMTWFRIKSNSLWTGVIIHSSHNLFIQGIFTPLTQDTGITKYFIGEFGIVLSIIAIFFAFYFWKRRSELINNAN